MNPFLRLVRAAAAASFAAHLVACGGGGSAADAPPPSPESPAPSIGLTAQGSSAHTVSLGWTAVTGATGYTLERRTAGGAFMPLAELPSDTRVYLDEGLSSQTAYEYRLLARRNGGSAASAQSAATTTSDVPLSTPAGAVLAELARGEVGAAGGRVASADGSVVLDVPAGAFSTITSLVLRSQVNTAPGGVEGGVQLEASTAPSKPLVMTLGYGEPLAASAAGLGAAVQRADGSWLSMPLQAVDRAARRMTVELPATTLVVTPANGARALAVALQAERQAAATAYRANVVRIQAMYLSPAGASIRTGATQRLVPFARVLVSSGVEEGCSSDPEELCVPLPIVEPRALPFSNDKPGYARQWMVQGVVGGNAALGSVQPLDTGAVYTAPARAPVPNPVTVTFRSTHQTTGRMVELSAAITVAEPTWTGIVHGTMEGIADIGFSFSAEAVWTLASATSDDEFHASGTQSVHVINVTCTASASPATVALPAGLLKIDRSTQPPSYTLEVGSLWNTVITGSCPGHGGGSAGMTVPGLLQTSGSVTGDGKRIEGSATLNNIHWVWSLSAEL